MADSASPRQLTNLAGASARGDAVANRSLPLAAALARCRGANCSSEADATTPPADALPCYVTSRV